MSPTLMSASRIMARSPTFSPTEQVTGANTRFSFTNRTSYAFCIGLRRHAMTDFDANMRQTSIFRSSKLVSMIARERPSRTRLNAEVPGLNDFDRLKSETRSLMLVICAIVDDRRSPRECVSNYCSSTLGTAAASYPNYCDTFPNPILEYRWKVSTGTILTNVRSLWKTYRYRLNLSFSWHCSSVVVSVI
jgi:hypothetical protein